MKWLRLCLQTIGALSLLLLTVVAFAVALGIYNGTSEKFNKATRNDSLFILNWGGISTNQNFKVVASYQSPKNVTGDHLDYYCIELPTFEAADGQKGQWHDGPEKNPLLAEALKLAVNDARMHGDCFPTAEKANSETMKIMFVSVMLHDREPTAADIILYDTSNHKLYYVSFKT
jgi:hypothetical protein